jgi:hypothetical protein
VQLACLARLNGSFAAVKPSEELASGRTRRPGA